MGVPRVHEPAPRLKALIVASSLLVAASAAAHGGETVSLTWQAPTSCPDQSAVLARVRSLLAASAGSTAPVQARATVSEAPGGYELTLETVQGERSGRRTMRAGSCDELADAAAL